MREPGRLIAMAAVLCVTAAGCSARSEGATARSSPDEITQAEMESSGHQDAYSLVLGLRPQWLRVRGTASLTVPEHVQVYLDGSRLGSVEHLRQISTHSISSLRYMDGMEATQRWGLDHGGGAIVITTRSGPNSGYD